MIDVIKKPLRCSGFYLFRFWFFLPEIPEIFGDLIEFPVFQLDQCHIAGNFFRQGNSSDMRELMQIDQTVRQQSDVVGGLQDLHQYFVTGCKTFGAFFNTTLFKSFSYDRIDYR